MARMRERLDAPVLHRRRRRVRLPRRPRPAGARLDPAARPGVGVPAGAGAAPAVAALPALQPALRARLRAPVRAPPARPLASPPCPTTSRSSGWAASGCRSRSPSPTAGCSVLGVDKDAERLAPLRARPDAVQGARHRGAARAGARGRAARALRARRRRRAGGRDRAHARHADLLAHRDRHARHPRGARRAAAAPARGPPAGAALHGRAAHDRVRRRLPGEAPRLPRRRGRLRRARARADRRRPLHRRDRDAAVHRRRRRRALRRARRARCSSGSARRSCRRRPCRPSWRRSGPTSCATRRSRCRTC